MDQNQPTASLPASPPGSWPVISLSVVAGMLLSPCLVGLAIAGMGAGHGSQDMAKLLFPYAALLYNGATCWILLALVQFPLYGLVLGFAWKITFTFFCWVAGLVLAMHVLAAWWVF